MTTTLHPRAQELISIPFKLGGRDAGKGLDCLGLCIAFYDLLGIDHVDPWTGVLRTSFDEGVDELQGTGRWLEVFGTDLEVGDLVTTENGRHVSVYVGGGWCLYTARNASSHLRALNRLETLEPRKWRRNR